MELKNVFDVFSRKPGAAVKNREDIPATTRNRVFMWCTDIFSNTRSPVTGGDYTHQFWEEIHHTLRMRHGRLQLSDTRRELSSRADDALTFLSSCSGTEFLDFLEYIFRVECYFHVGIPSARVVAELNELLRQDSLPYHLTEFIREEAREASDGPPFFGREQTVIRTVAFPMVIARDNEVVHSHIVEPVLKLLQRPAFKSANAEYLEALEDFRKGDLGDSLTKCGSALESVMKIICDHKKWPYQQKDTASALIKTIIERSNLETYIEPGLILVATLRNKLSKAHGAGVQTKAVPRHLAAYALNSTAVAILLLVAEAGME
jgi:hypothetical protein